MRRHWFAGLVLVTLGCAGAVDNQGPTEQELKLAAAKARNNGTATGDACAEHAWYGDGVCDTFCGHADQDCAPKDSGSGGGSTDPVACDLISEIPNGTCSRPASDPCRFQDPDCSPSGSGGNSGSGGGSAGGSTGSGTVDCDVTKVTCQTLIEVTCPEGQVPSVVNACYGACVPKAQCEPVACLTFVESPDGVCSRLKYDPCRGQDPDCKPDQVVCAQFIEQPDGVCGRAPDDPCIFQDPDCVKK